jgi:hypothetical protein
MPLVDVLIPDEPAPLPFEVKRFLREADLRVEAELAEARSPAFVPSNYERVYPVLRTLADSALLRGHTFCEWGSGLGVVTCAAALLGYDAYGIEAEWGLVEEARKLADDFDLSAEFVCGSFIPTGGEDHVYRSGEYTWFTTQSDSAYHDLGLDPSDFDIVYAYPWPDEEEVVSELFEMYAGTGAVLLTCKGGEGFRLRRKVEKKRRKR